MTTIHDDDPGSRVHQLQSALQAQQAACERLARRKDELELALAAGRLGFCRIVGATRELHASSQFKAEWGWPPDAPLGWHDLQARIHGSDWPKFNAAIRAATSEMKTVEVLVRAQPPDRATQWIAIRGRSLCSDDGSRVDVVITSRNVTREHRATVRKRRGRLALLRKERQMRAVAEATNRAKDEFLSVISHELRSPLNAILGWNRILTLKRNEDPEVASITPRIEHSARAQLKMVNDLLDLGRVGTGKLRIEPRATHLAKLAHAALDLARPAATAKAVELETDFQAGAGALRGDPERLQQVIDNLLSNAIKFTPECGRVTLILRNVDACCELIVRDTGRGIEAQLLPFVFDRFRQADCGKSRGNGLGLGLTMVREIVSLHGGSVSAASSGPGQGAEFVVKLPLNHQWPDNAPVRPAVSLPEARASQNLRGLSILVVDDEADARTVIAETLRLEGAQVTVTDCAGAAFQHLKADDARFDVIVTDIGMPGEDGYSLVRKLRTLHNGRRILAIAVTGYVTKNDVLTAMEAGFDLHVPKPIDFESFLPLVRRLAALK